MVSATPRYTPSRGATHIIGIDISNRITQLNHSSVLNKRTSCTNSSPFDAIFVYFSLCHSPKMHLIRSVRKAENTSPWPELGQRLIRRKTGSSKRLSKWANRELKQRRFWATHVNRKWTFFILGQRFCPDFSPHRLYKNKDSYQYKSGAVKAYCKGKGLNFAWRPSLKNAFA